MPLPGDHEGGAAKRRLDRRLRMHWRHEQLTLQMALAAALHHSCDVGPVSYNALRSQRTARAWEWGREQNYHLGENNYRFDVVQIDCFRLNTKL